MKKSIKKLLIFSQVLGWSALVATACTDDQVKNTTQITSKDSSLKKDKQSDPANPKSNTNDPTNKHQTANSYSSDNNLNKTPAKDKDSGDQSMEHSSGTNEVGSTQNEEMHTTQKTNPPENKSESEVNTGTKEAKDDSMGASHAMPNSTETATQGPKGDSREPKAHEQSNDPSQGEGSSSTGETSTGAEPGGSPVAPKSQA